jgi:deoxyribonuclease-1
MFATLLLLATQAQAFEVEEFDNGLGEWEFTPQRIGRSTLEGWSVVDDAGDRAIQNNPSPSSATYYWSISREIDLLNARSPRLAVRLSFTGNPYDSVVLQAGPPGSTRASDFTTLLELREPVTAPTDYSLDLSPWDEQKATIRVLVKKANGALVSAPGLSLHHIGVVVEPEPPPPPPPPEILSIGSFNVQVFGLTKLDKPGVAEALVQVADRYDLLLIQEIRDKSGTAILELLDLLNTYTDDDFSLIVSDRLGRTASKEQYAYLYRTSKLSVLDSYTYDDGLEPSADLFEREPFLVHFASPTTGRDFAIGALHTSPDRTPEELSYLSDVRDDMQAHFEEEDLLIVGDFNAGCSYLTPTEASSLPIYTDPNITWQIPDNEDTTASATVCPYDRILTSAGLEGAVVTGSASVFRYDVPLALSPTFTKTVSDHYPVEILLDLSLGD